MRRAAGRNQPRKPISPKAIDAPPPAPPRNPPCRRQWPFATCPKTVKSTQGGCLDSQAAPVQAIPAHRNRYVPPIDALVWRQLAEGCPTTGADRTQRTSLLRSFRPSRLGSAFSASSRPVGGILGRAPARHWRLRPARVLDRCRRGIRALRTAQEMPAETVVGQYATPTLALLQPTCPTAAAAATPVRQHTHGPETAWPSLIRENAFELAISMPSLPECLLALAPSVSSASALFGPAANGRSPTATTGPPRSALGLPARPISQLGSCPRRSLGESPALPARSGAGAPLEFQ